MTCANFERTRRERKRREEEGRGKSAVCSSCSGPSKKKITCSNLLFLRKSKHPVGNRLPRSPHNITTKQKELTRDGSSHKPTTQHTRSLEVFFPFLSLPFLCAEESQRANEPGCLNSKRGADQARRPSSGESGSHFYFLNTRTKTTTR